MLKAIKVELDLGLDLDLNLNSNNNTQAPEQITTGPYIYRAIATNLEILSDSKIVREKIIDLKKQYAALIYNRDKIQEIDDNERSIVQFFKLVSILSVKRKKSNLACLNGFFFLQV
jgi:hypothetical protein